jgi:molybdopterin-guanine dinucleotide biosynthesis protein A
MPGLKVDFLRLLLDAAERCDGDALVPRGPSGRLEPLCAVYHRRSHTGLDAAFARGVRQVASALEDLRCIPWPVPEASYFQNVNTPEEWTSHGR